MIEIEWVKEYLDMLLVVRNAIAHGNARVRAIKPAKLRKMERWEKEKGGIIIGADYVSFTSEFIGGMAQAVTVTLNNLMNRVKEKY